MNNNYLVENTQEEIIKLKNEQTKNITATVMVTVFGVFFVLSLVGGLVILFKLSDSEKKITSFKEFVVTLSAIFAGPMSAIFGYYFREVKEINKSNQNE